MRNLQNEIMNETDHKHETTILKLILEKKTETELQLSFLIIPVVALPSIQ